MSRCAFSVCPLGCSLSGESDITCWQLLQLLLPYQYRTISKCQLGKGHRHKAAHSNICCALMCWAVCCISWQQQLWPSYPQLPSHFWQHTCIRSHIASFCITDPKLLHRMLDVTNPPGCPSCGAGGNCVTTNLVGFVFQCDTAPHFCHAASFVPNPLQASEWLRLSQEAMACIWLSKVA